MLMALSYVVARGLSRAQFAPLLVRRNFSRWSSRYGWQRNRWDGQTNSRRPSSSPDVPFVVTSLSLGSFFSSGGKNGGQSSLSKPAYKMPVELSRVMLPDDTNPMGNVHGGTILKLIEHAGVIVSTRHCNSAGDRGKGPFITALARVEHMDFYQPMYVGEVAQVHAAVTYTSPNSCEVTAEVWAENVLTGGRRRTNRATLWYVAFPANGNSALKPVAVPQLEGLTAGEASEGLKRYKAQKGSRASASNSKQGLTHPNIYQPLSEAPEHTVLSSQTTLATLVLPSDCVRGAYLMGGPLMKLMDNAAGICAARHSRSPVVTACINAIDFHGPVRNGEAVFCTARLVFCSEKSMMVEIITEAEGLASGSRRVVNTAYFTFVSIGFDRKAHKVPPLTLTSEEEHQRFKEGKARYEERKKARMLEKPSKK
jgi:acyl-coenzyme A thioesterase 7